MYENKVATNQASEYAKSSKELCKKVSKKSSKELGKKKCKKCSNEVGKKYIRKGERN